MCENVFKSRKGVIHSCWREIVKIVHYSLLTLSVNLFLYLEEEAQGTVRNAV